MISPGQVRAFKQSPLTSSSRPQHAPSLPPCPQEPPWSNDVLRNLAAILRNNHGPFALGTIVRLLGRRDFEAVGTWLIRGRQSARALASRRSSASGRKVKIPDWFCVPVAHQRGDGVTSVIGGADDLRLRIYAPSGEFSHDYEIGETDFDNE
ncbi:hypothetical protein EsH8_V_001153 [Colletotrichum jinshuiense]